MRRGGSDDAAAGAAWKAAEMISGFFFVNRQGVFDRGDLPGTCNCPSVAPGYSD